MISVLVVDDHRIFRSGIKRLLSDEPDIRVTDEAANGTEALAKIRQRPFDVVMLDINMTGRSGLEAIACLRGEAPATPILIVSMYPEEQYAAVALKAGARGYVSRMPIRGPRRAIREVCRGRIYVSPHFARACSCARSPRAGAAPLRSVGARAADHDGDREGPFPDAHRRADVPQRQDGQRLPQAHPGEARAAQQRELVRYALRHRVID